MFKGAPSMRSAAPAAAPLCHLGSQKTGKEQARHLCLSAREHHSEVVEGFASNRCAWQCNRTRQQGRAHPGWVVLQGRSLPPGCSHVGRHRVLTLPIREQHLMHLVDIVVDAGGMDVPALHAHVVMSTLHPGQQVYCRALYILMC